MIAQLKSLILSMGLLDKHLTVEQAVLLSRLEEEYQVKDHLRPDLPFDDQLLKLVEEAPRSQRKGERNDIFFSSSPVSPFLFLRSSAGGAWSGPTTTTSTSCGPARLPPPSSLTCARRAPLSSTS